MSHLSLASCQDVRVRERERESLLLRKNFDGNNHSKCSLGFFVLSCIMIIFMNLNVCMYNVCARKRLKRKETV